MRKIRATNKKIKTMVRNHFEEQIQNTPLPETPRLYNSLLKRSEAILQHDFTRKENLPPPKARTGFVLFRVAAAVLLIACGTAMFAYPGKQNQLAELVTNIAEENDFEEKIISGLQKAGHFLNTNL
jgi:hypothetical protein